MGVAQLLRTWFANPAGLWLLAMLPVVASLALFARRHKRRALAPLGKPPAPRLRGSGRWFWLRRTCLTAGIALLALGVAGPRWGRGEEPPGVPGRDLVVVLDLSRSMLAEDVLPNRLGRARQALLDLSRAAQRR